MLSEALRLAKAGLSVLPLHTVYDGMCSCGKQNCSSPGKHPITRHGVNDATTDEQIIREWFSKWPDANLGIRTGRGLVVIDIDAHHGGMEGWLRYINEKGSLIKTATVKTGNGGYHLYFRHTEMINNRVNFLPGVDVRGDGGYVVAPPSLHISGQRYVWHRPLAAIQELPEWLARELIVKQPSSEIPPITFQEGSRDNNLFTVALALRKGGMDYENTLAVLKALAQCCNPPMPPNVAKEKVDSAFKRLPISLSERIREWLSDRTGVFSLAQMSADLGLDRTDRIMASKLLYKMVQKGELQKHGERSGIFRIPDLDYVQIDIANADPGKSLDIVLPLGLSELVSIYPKNIIVVAGVSNAGKTAFLMNIARMNIGKMKPIIYLSSEMGAEELRRRIDKFGDDIELWQNITFIERSHNFSDLIVPDGLNIIDFLEIYDAFYKVGDDLKKIYDALGNGVAVIALQKKPGEIYGRGGGFSSEKARLYITLDNNKLTIVKAKNWKTAKNPNWMCRRFRVEDGCKIIEKGDWFYVNPDG